MIFPKNENGFKVEPSMYDYSQGVSQFQMIKDWHRTKCYFNQIEKYVKDKVVVDFGAGSGILGVYAALCGAKYVYFVEIEEKMHDVIRRMCEMNNIQNFSIKRFYDECEEKKFDVCISEMMGSLHLEAGFEMGLKTYSQILKDNENCIAIPESISLYAIQTYSDEVEKEKQYLKNFKDVKLNESDFINENILRFTSQKSIFKKIGENKFLKNIKFKEYSEAQSNIFKKITLRKGFNCLNFGWEVYVGHDVFLKHFPKNDNDYSSWMYGFLCIDGDNKDYDLEMNMYGAKIQKSAYFKYKINFV